MQANPDIYVNNNNKKLKTPKTFTCTIVLLLLFPVLKVIVF
jgi:hypothetical protein